MIEIKVLDSKSIINQKLLSDSSNDVYRGNLSKEAGEHLSVDTSVPIFLKNTSKRKAQEEASFSLLYQMDIGEQAANTILVSRDGKIIGNASIGLSNFQPYWKLSDSDCHYKKEVFELDKNGLPIGIKKVSGLANILMSAWLYAEDDLHRANFGVAQNSNGDLIWVRLDFGLSLASITQDNGRTFREVYHHFDDISLNDLQNFPVLKDAKPFYWPTSLDIYNHTLNFKGGLKNNTYTENDKKMFGALAQNPIFIKEKNEFLLSQFLVEINAKTSLLSKNIDAPSGNQLAGMIESKILKLRWTALADPDFRDFVIELSTNKKAKEQFFKRIVKRQCDTVKQPKALCHDHCVTEFNEVVELINIINTHEPKKLHHDCNEASLSVLKARQDKSFSRIDSDEVKTLTRLRNASFARYLSDPFLALSLSERLDNLHSIIDNVLVLNSMNQLIDSYVAADHSILSFYTKIRNNWLSPNVRISELSDSAKALLSHQFLKGFMSTPTSNPKHCLHSVGHIIDYSMTTLLPKFIHASYENKILLKDEKRTDFGGDIKRLNSLFTEFLTEDFFKKLEHGSVPKSVEKKFTKHLQRINHLMSAYHISVKSLVSFQEMPEIKQQAFVQELSFILSRMALDLQAATAKHDLQKRAVKKGSLAAPINEEITLQLILANEKLSLAMAEPKYHNKESLSEVAEAGLLGARALRNPTFENANACLAHVDKLSDSNQVRLMTKVAAALAVISGLVLGLSLLALFGPFALPIIGTASALALKTTATVSAVTFFSAGAYGLNRKNRDTDKANRCMLDVSEAAYKTL